MPANSASDVGSAHQVGRSLQTVPDALVETSRPVTIDARVQCRRAQLARLSPGLGLVHEGFADAGTAPLAVDDQRLNPCLTWLLQRGPLEDVQHANDQVIHFGYDHPMTCGRRYTLEAVFELRL